MPSCRNATRPGATGVLRPAVTSERAGLRRDYPMHPALAPFVERYWSVRWECRAGAPHRADVLAHPCVNLTVEEGDRPRHGHALPAALLHGVVTRRFAIDLDGWGRCIGAKFRPGGFTAFAGRAAARDTVHALAEPDLVRDALAVDDDAGRAAVLDVVLAARAPEPDVEYLDLTRIVGEMAASRQLTRVDQVAARAGLSVRALQRLFRRFVGVGPKWVLARYRLQDAAAMIDAGDDDLAGLAAELGWSDQAHFSRDFRATVGATPSAYLAQARSDGSRTTALGPASRT